MEGRAPNRCLERARSKANAHALLPDNRHRDRRALGLRCPACRTTSADDLRNLDRHSDAAVTSSHPRPLLPLMRAESAIWRAGAAVVDHRR
jgi:hypothetical protein